MRTIHSVFRPRLALRTGRFLYGSYLIQLSSVPRADLFPDQPYQVDPVFLFSKLNITAARGNTAAPSLIKSSGSSRYRSFRPVTTCRRQENNKQTLLFSGSFQLIGLNLIQAGFPFRLLFLPHITMYLMSFADVKEISYSFEHTFAFRDSIISPSMRIARGKSKEEWTCPKYQASHKISCSSLNLRHASAN